MSTIESSLTAGAVISSGVTGHSRQDDHYGTQPDTLVVLDGQIGQWPSGTDVHTVLGDIINRLAALESTNLHVGVMSAGAFIRPWFPVRSVIRRTQSQSWQTIDAKITLGKTNQPISADAMLIKLHQESMAAGAWIIDDVIC